MKETDKNNSNATSAIKNSTKTQVSNSSEPKIIQLKKKYVTDEMPAELRKNIEKKLHKTNPHKGLESLLIYNFANLTQAYGISL